AGHVWSVARRARASSPLYAATDVGASKSTDGGDTWMHSDPGLRSRVSSVAIDPTDASTAYAGADPGLFRTTSGGSQWTPILRGSISAVAVPSAAPNTIYVGSAFGGVGVRNHTGVTWTVTNTDTSIWTITADPIAPTTAYMGMFGTTDAFVTRVSADGSTIEYSSYLGGGNFDYGNAIAVDGQGNAFVTGATQSRDFP